MIVKNNTYEVENPKNRRTYEHPNDTENEVCGFLVNYALANTIDRPYDIENRQTENNFSES